METRAGVPVRHRLGSLETFLVEWKQKAWAGVANTVFSLKPS